MEKTVGVSTRAYSTTYVYAIVPLGTLAKMLFGLLPHLRISNDTLGEPCCGVSDLIFPISLDSTPLKTEMTKEKIISIVNSSLVIGSAFILCAALGMLINPDAFYKFFSPVQLVPDPIPPSQSVSYYWDLKGYAQMALNNQCIAFYPLWPLLIRILFHPQSVEQAAYSFLVLSTVLFFISLPLLVWVFKKAFNHQSLAFLSVLAFSLSPMAIFRVIGYTESLFTILSAVFIGACLRQSRLNEILRLALVFSVTFVMSLTRPILMPFFFSSIAALGTIYLFDWLQLERRNRSNLLRHVHHYGEEIKITITLCLAAVIGYLPYGLFCLRSRGSFFAPFTDQSLWGTKLGLHLELLLFPKSPLFDLYGLYFPVLVLVLSLFLVYFKVRNEEPLVWIPQSPLWMILFLYPPLLVVTYIANYLRLRSNTNWVRQDEISHPPCQGGSNQRIWDKIKPNGSKASRGASSLT
ncbi:MAG: hypothetical protein ICV85_09470, partial [Tolypothrix sp. T3-bin4]|nr:hypothetical protein [Tolypothrix sp. T3-bin4]